MAYDNDVVFVFTGGLTFGELGEKRIKNCPLWFGIEANLKKRILAGELDFIETVAPVEAITRYENFLKNNLNYRDKEIKIKNATTAMPKVAEAVSLCPKSFMVLLNRKRA
jgi:hypothetical protein